MSDLTLGIELGSGSIGWALLDEGAWKIIAAGVRVFPEGVERDASGGEHSKNEARRFARGRRRRVARRARRKKQLRLTLVSAGLLPAEKLEQTRLDGLNPFELRRGALDQKLSPHEIGRAIVHLNQRRGFSPTRKAGDRERETEGMLADIRSLAKEIKTAGRRTLGEHLATLAAKTGEVPLYRIRGRHTHREMLVDEFNAIWASQQKNHPTLLTDELKARLQHIIFFQRKTYWPPSAFSHCDLEPRLLRCPRADRRAQRFRLLQEVNSLRILDTAIGVERKLTSDERTRLLTFLSKTKALKFDTIRQKLALSELVRFNLERDGREKLRGLYTDAILSHKNLFGKTWSDLPEDDKNRLVSALTKGDENYIRLLGVRLALAPKLIDALVATDLDEGYARYSLHAIKRLLPHLEHGLSLSTTEGFPCALSKAGYILPGQYVPKQQQFLPDPPSVTNPLASQALYEVRKVVNALLRDVVYKHGHTLVHVNIEMAREIKSTAAQRRLRIFEMRDWEDQRDQAADEIRKHGDKVTREKIEKYGLWEEQSRLCIYSGRPISLAQLLGNEVDVDYILPRSRSLDGSFANKVVCFQSEIADKGTRTPYEWLADSDPEKFQQVLQRTTKLSYSKAQRFRQSLVSLEDFFTRWFIDTTYIATQVKQYVRCLGVNVECIKGQYTPELRWQWGMNSVLGNDTLKLNNRDDYRHHAINAIVIALTSHSRLQRIASIYRKEDKKQPGEVRIDPWPGFRRAAEEVVTGINVSHRVQRKVNGELHKETMYGPTSLPGKFAVRKPLESLTLPMVNDIRDNTIKQLVIDRLRQYGIEPGTHAKLPKDLWKEPLQMKSGVPIRKVRLIRRDLTIQPIRRGTANVKTGNTHHLCLFEFKDIRGKTRRDVVFVSMLEAINRIQARQPVIQKTYPGRPDAKFVMSIATNEIVALKHDGIVALYRFQTAASTSQQMLFRHHAAAGNSQKNPGVISKKPGTFDGRKVTIDPIGRIRWAND